MADMDQDIGRDSSIGQRLRSAREARELTLDDVATQTRIPIRHLRAIEDGNWSELPAITYTVGFARSYANAVGLDGAEVGRQVRAEVGGTPKPTQLSPVYYSPPDPARVPSRPLAWVAAVLAILLVGGYLWWRSRLASDDQVAKAPVAAEQPAVPPQQAPPPSQQPPQNMTGQQVTLVAAEDVWIQVNDRGRSPAVRADVLRSGDRWDVPASLADPVLRTARPQVLRISIGGRDLGTLDTVQRTLSNVSLKPQELVDRIGPRAIAAPAAGAPAEGNGSQPQL